jgi:exodeoxyribonuclease V gamma subunit
VGLRLPEEETPLAEHEPFGAPGPLPRYALRQAAFDAWLREGARPGLKRLHAALLARALLAPGADGETTLAAVLDDMAPFARCALEEGFGPVSTTQPFAVTLGAHRLQGALEGVQRGGVLRVALRPEGRHGGQALRHGLDWLAASLHDLPLYEIACVDERHAVRLDTWPALSRESAQASLAILLGLRDETLRAPLPFLPKSGFAYHAQLHKALAKAGEGAPPALLAALRDDALAKASAEWCGNANNDRRRGEAGPATRLALRGRDPFHDDDAGQRERFARISEELFGAFAQRRALRAQALQ